MFKDLIQSIYEKFILSISKNALKHRVWRMKNWKSLGKWYVSTGKEWICHSDYELEEFKNLFLILSILKNGIISPLIQILCRFNNHKESRKLFVKIFIKKCVISRFLFSWYDAFYILSILSFMV